MTRISKAQIEATTKWWLERFPELTAVPSGVIEPTDRTQGNAIHPAWCGYYMSEVEMLECKNFAAKCAKIAGDLKEEDLPEGVWNCSDSAPCGFCAFRNCVLGDSPLALYKFAVKLGMEEVK